MAKVQEATTAPDFTLTDTQGRSITLSGYQGHQYVVLVFNRGFT
jgi:peroxiredoxin